MLAQRRLSSELWRTLSVQFAHVAVARCQVLRNSSRTTVKRRVACRARCCTMSDARCSVSDTRCSVSVARCSVSVARGMPPVARVVPRLERVEGVVARVLDQVHMQLVDLLARRAEGQCGTHQIRYCKMLPHCVYGGRYPWSHSAPKMRLPMMS